ncbi:hypothetical protein ACFX2G_044825 [Malus domestica]
MEPPMSKGSLCPTDIPTNVVCPNDVIHPRFFSYDDGKGPSQSDVWKLSQETDHRNTSIEEIKKAEQAKRLEKEEHELIAVLKGPNHAFGELIAASAITDEML